MRLRSWYTSGIDALRTRRRVRVYLYSILILILAIVVALFAASRDAEERYATLLSVVVNDRNGIPIRVMENKKGHYALTGGTLPDSFQNHLLTKEDQHFFYHPGVNPVSMARALYRKITTGRSGGSSTLTEQLAKNLLHTENDRTVLNKIRELLYVFGMELFMRKETILTMYGNTVYLGNQVQGFETGSRMYFGKKVSELTPHEASVLLATLSHPTMRNPLKEENSDYARTIFARITGEGANHFVAPPVAEELSFRDASWFEISSLDVTCTTSCTTSIDTALTQFIRATLVRTIDHEYDRGVKNGAVVVIDARTHELLAIVGSPDPEKTTDGGQINMALKPRPIGSTIKPLIYLKGFEEGLRPYTLVDDREYRYPIATGYSLYPKNFDGKYHGEVTLHFALSNSLNVPSVKVLEYIGLPNFYSFLGDDLGLVPIQPFDSYQYGIALGGLETDLLTLTHFMSLFPNEGVLSPLQMLQSESTLLTPPHEKPQEEKRIARAEHVRLVTTILKDRLTGVEQFGLQSSLNLSSNEYAVKTGTSRDFHDSWVVGYTPDFVVGVWLGNSENTALAQVSGQSGAGTVWHDVMEYLLSSPYNSKRSFTQSGVRLLAVDKKEEWGLVSDDPKDHRTLLTSNALITSIHEGDMFEYEDGTRIPLRARVPLIWYANGKNIGEGNEVTFTPNSPGTYEIEGKRIDDPSVREILNINISLQNR